MAETLALQLSKWTIDLASRLIKARVRLHNTSVIEPDMAIIFAANHFTRMETLLLPYMIQKHIGLTAWSLAAEELFHGHIGQYLRSEGVISTCNPDRDAVIIRALLRGDHPWIFFPEGAMIKDKRLTPGRGGYELYDGQMRRPPHTGAAALALRAAYCRAKLRCLHQRGNGAALARALAQFKLGDIEEIEARRTVIIPVNITYYPIRVRDNIFLRAARHIVGDMNKRTLDELSVEGTILAESTDIDVNFGEPMDIEAHLAAPEYASIMACGLDDLDALANNPREVFQKGARHITHQLMNAIYGMTRINIDHIFAEIIRRQPEGKHYRERDYRERIYLAARQLRQASCLTHPLLDEQVAHLLDDEPHEPFQEFLDTAIRENFLTPSDWGYRKTTRRLLPFTDHQATPKEAGHEVIASEIEAACNATSAVRHIARAPVFLVRATLRNQLLRRETREYEEDYARFYEPSHCKPPQVGKPFLLRPWRIRGGVVLAHGYMAAPLEVRMLAEHLYRKGFAVYGVRLKGHGTAPEDLAQRQWEEWYKSLNRGYAVMRTLTENIFLGGFSTGGCLALLGAARKQEKIKAAFSICAPLSVRNYSIRLVPSIITLNTLLKRIGQSQYAWEYVENDPENKHINYTRNPLTGVRQLTMVMNATADSLPSIRVPTLVIQASKDTTVDPISGAQIFEKINTRHKRLIVFERERHGIINGEGSQEIFEQVAYYLESFIRQARSQRYWLLGRRLGEVFSGSAGRHDNSTPEEPKKAASAVDVSPPSVL